jgi:hypothetical protein
VSAIIISTARRLAIARPATKAVYINIMHKTFLAIIRKLWLEETRQLG